MSDGVLLEVSFPVANRRSNARRNVRLIAAGIAALQTHAAACVGEEGAERFGLEISLACKNAFMQREHLRCPFPLHGLIHAVEPSDMFNHLSPERGDGVAAPCSVLLNAPGCNE